MTPLHAAAAAGHREVCACLLQAGTNAAVASARDGRGRLPEAWAARRGHKALARLLANSRRRPKAVEKAEAAAEKGMRMDHAGEYAA